MECGARLPWGDEAENLAAQSRRENERASPNPLPDESAAPARSRWRDVEELAADKDNRSFLSALKYVPIIGSFASIFLDVTDTTRRLHEDKNMSADERRSERWMPALVLFLMIAVVFGMRFYFGKMEAESQARREADETTLTNTPTPVSP